MDISSDYFSRNVTEYLKGFWVLRAIYEGLYRQ